MPAFDVIVVGGGIIGSATAFSLAKRDIKVLLADQDDVPSAQASSADHGRIFRLTYGKDSFYTELAVRTLPLWRSFQLDAKEELFLQTGMLDIAVSDGKYEEQSFKVLKEMGLNARLIKPPEACEQYRMLRGRAFKSVLHHPDAGIIWAQKAITAFTNAAKKRKAVIGSGVKIAKILRSKTGIQGLKDARGKVYTADHYVFAAGPWTGELLKEFGLPLIMTKQESLYFRPPRNQGRYRPAHFPVFAAKGFFGFPVHIHGFMRLGAFGTGPASRTVNGQPVPDKNFEKKCRTFLKNLIPDLADFTDLEGKACYYTRTADGDPIIDKLTGVENGWVATGFGGRGTTFAPLVGEIMAQFITGNKPDVNLHRFRIERLKLRK